MVKHTSTHGNPNQNKKNPICNPTDDAPGKRASADQLFSAQLGLILQMSGTLTNLQTIGATIFVDHFSDHTYVYLMQDLLLSETLAAKHTYERFLGSSEIKPKAYHADNGRFADKGFQDLVGNSNFGSNFWDPIRSGILIPVLIPKIPVRIFFLNSAVEKSKNWNSDSEIWNSKKNVGIQYTSFHV